jgi:zinc D-Ala-D-Ala carboxypeptidase
MNYFTADELKCQHCGAYWFDDDFLLRVNLIREECNFPFRVTSAYRCPDHPIEAAKKSPGAHASGKAIDIAVTGEKALKLIQVAQRHGIKRIGINQKGNARFIHLDADDTLPSPAIWSY